MTNKKLYSQASALLHKCQRGHTHTHTQWQRQLRVTVRKHRAKRSWKTFAHLFVELRAAPSFRHGPCLSFVTVPEHARRGLRWRIRKRDVSRMIATTRPTLVTPKTWPASGCNLETYTTRTEMRWFVVDNVIDYRNTAARLSASGQCTVYVSNGATEVISLNKWTPFVTGWVFIWQRAFLTSKEENASVFSGGINLFGRIDVLRCSVDWYLCSGQATISPSHPPTHPRLRRTDTMNMCATSEFDFISHATVI